MKDPTNKRDGMLIYGWLLIFFFIVILFICIVVFTMYIIKNRDNQQLCINTGISDLIDITNEPCCCDDTIPTQNKFLTQYNMLVNPSNNISYSAVCSGYCEVLTETDEGIVCTSSNNPDAQTEYNQCISLLNPVNCIGQSKPIAYSNDILYYPQEIGNETCTSTYVCGSTGNVCVRS